MWYPTGSPRCLTTLHARAGRVHQPAPSASSSRRRSGGSLCFAVLLLSVVFSTAAAQAAVLSLGVNATTTTSLNLRTGPGVWYAVQWVIPAGASVAVNDGPFNTSWYQVTYRGQPGYVNGTYLTQSASNGGSSTMGKAPISTIDLSQYSTWYEANNGYVYTGWRAQVLHHLNALYATRVTTYASHTGCPTCSADLWTPGAHYGADNNDMQSMNDMAEYIRANVSSLGIKFVIWNRRYSTGGARIKMKKQGSNAWNPRNTTNHKDHVHITFLDSFN